MAQDFKARIERFVVRRRHCRAIVLSTAASFSLRCLHERMIMRDHSKHIQISREEVVCGLLAACDFASEFEMARLDESFGRILAEDVIASYALPNALTCRMDSIAVH